MAQFVFTPVKVRLLQKLLDFVNDDIRVALLMTNTNVESAGIEDAANLAAITTLDEMDGANYARKALTTKAVSEDDPNNLAKFSADDVLWAALGAGTRSVKGVLLYKRIDGTAANDQPIAWMTPTGFPFAASGGDVTVRWNANGILQAT